MGDNYCYTFCAEYSNEYTKYKPQKHYGLTFGLSYADAAEKIEKYYGKDLLAVRLEPIESVDLVILEESIISGLINDAYEH